MLKVFLVVILVILFVLLLPVIWLVIKGLALLAAALFTVGASICVAAMIVYFIWKALIE